MLEYVPCGKLSCVVERVKDFQTLLAGILAQTPVFDSNPAAVGSLRPQDAYLVTTAHNLICYLNDAFADVMSDRTKVPSDALAAVILSSAQLLKNTIDKLSPTTGISSENAKTLEQAHRRIHATLAQ
jgi:hypothetical protein